MKNRGALEMVRTLVCVAAMMFAAASAVAEAKSCKLTFYGYSGTTTLTDFQALVRLPAMVPGFSYADFAAADGSDVWFTDELGNVIPHEIDTWNTNGVSCLWVKVPTLSSSNTFITMHWGEMKTAEQTTSTTDVWTDYKGVWHLAELSGTAADSTANGLNGTPTGPATADMIADYGIVGNARINSNADGIGVGGYLSIPSYTLGNTFTVSGWFKTQGLIAGYGRLFSRKVDWKGTGWEVYYCQSPDKIGASGSNSTQVNNLSIPSVRTDWVNVVAVFSGTTYSLYANGARVGGGTVAAPTDNGNPLSFGSNVDGSQYVFCGKYDELRLRGGALSADRIKADYDTVQAPELFLCGRDPVTTTAKQADLLFYGYTGVSSLANFQALVKLPAAVPGFSYSDYPTADGRDIWFSDEQGNVIPHEIDTWDTAGDSYIWVCVPAVIDSTTYVTMHWGGAKTAEQIIAPTAVWTGYKGVWHLREKAGVTADSTTSNLPGTPSGAAAEKVKMVADSGPVGNARINSTVSGRNKGSYLTVPSYTLGNTFTVSGWFKASSVPTGDYPRFFDRKKSTGSDAGWMVFLYANPEKVGAGGNDSRQIAQPLNIPSTEADWVNVVAIYSGSAFSLYANGEYAGGGTVTAPTDNGQPLAFGCNPGGTQAAFSGKYDELRLCSGVLSADRIKADYLTVHDPVAFLRAREATEDNRVETAEWIGGGDVLNLLDSRNWRCLNHNGVVVENGVPTNTYTRAVVSGTVNFQLPANGTVHPWKRLILDDIALTADADWRGLGPETEISGTIDLKGHTLRMTEFPQSGSGTIVSTDAGEYVELSYLQSDSNCYIDTGIAHDANTIVDMKVEPVSLPGNNAFVCYYGSRTGVRVATSFSCWIHTGSNGTRHYQVVSATEQDVTSLPSPQRCVPFTVHLEKNGPCTIDGESLATGSGGGCGLNDYLFGINQAGTAQNFARVRMYYCQIYTGESKIRDFIPVMRTGTGEFGMLDRVENKFHEKLGGGEFVGGGPVLTGRTVGEVRIDVPTGKTVVNSTVRLVGLIRLVKEGAGSYQQTLDRQYYAGGTYIEGGKVVGVSGNGLARFGLYATETRVCDGATFDMVGGVNGFYAYKFVSAGGSFQNSSPEAPDNQCQWSDILLGTNATVNLPSSYGVINYDFAPTRVDLGGHTMTVELGNGKSFYLFNALVTNGVVKVEGDGGWLKIDKTRLEARTADFDLNCAVSVGVPVDVRNYTARWTDNYNAGTAAFNVHGVFTPVTDYFYGCTMQDGSTIDLSAKSAAWSTRSLFTQGARDVSFADGATVLIAIGKRRIANGATVVTWSQPPGNLETLKFKIKEGGRGSLLKTPEGLCYDCGLLVIVR